MRTSALILSIRMDYLSKVCFKWFERYGWDCGPLRVLEEMLNAEIEHYEEDVNFLWRVDYPYVKLISVGAMPIREGVLWLDFWQAINFGRQLSVKEFALACSFFKNDEANNYETVKIIRDYLKKVKLGEEPMFIL